MADIRLVRPEAGTNQAVACEPEARFVFDFPTDAATLSRNGDNLVMTFEDGASLTLTDFYKAYSSKNMPSFEVDGAQVAGADFFAAMNEPDLMPAAGPGGRGAAGVGGGRYHEYANMALYDGLDRLGGLDVGWPDGGYEPEIDGAAARRGDEGVAIAGSINNIPMITVPEEPEPTPDPDNSDPDKPDDPKNPDPDSPFIPNTNSASIVVDEGALDGKGPHMSHGASGDNTFNVELHGEGGTIVVGDESGKYYKFTVEKDGTVTFEDHTEGKGLTTNGVTVTLTEDSVSDTFDGTVKYHYELKDGQEHDKDAGNDEVLFDEDGIDITATDGTGDVATGKLTAEVHDDVPVMSVTGASVTVDMGADSDGAYGDKGQATVEVFEKEDGQLGTDAVQWKHGDVQTSDLTEMETGETWTSEDGSMTVTKNEDGSYDFKLAEDKPAKDITVRATDADNDTAEENVTLTPPTITVPKDPDPDPDPDNPDTPEPTPDPDDPDPDPDPDPDSPFIPNTNSASIVVDEGALDGKGPHKSHGSEGNNSFKVDLHSEGGTIVVGDENGEHYKITVDKDGKVTNFEDNTKGKGLTTNGVTVTLDEDSVQPDGTVNYHYKLDGSLEHDKNTNDDVLFDKNGIDITVTDGTGDVATGKLTAEVHDDVPVMSVTGASVTVDMGADSDGAYGDKGQATVEVFEQDENGQPMPNAVQWEHGDVQTSDLTEMGNGDTWTSADGSMTVTKNEDGSYDFNLVEDNAPSEDSEEKVHSKDITVRATDADGDTAEENVTLTPPTVEVPPQEEPKPDPNDPDTPEPTPDPDDPDPDPNPDPDSPFIPNTNSASIVVDEGALDGKGPHKSHGAEGDNSFKVDLHSEGGTIVVGDENGEHYKITVDKDGKVTGFEDHTMDHKGLTTNGVTVTLDEDSVQPDGTVNYHYKLDGSLEHDKNNNDDVLFDKNGIDIKVTDGTGDVATGKLTAEVHDDVPVMSVEGASVTVDMGADSDGVYGGTGQATVEVFEQDENGQPKTPAVTWNKGGESQGSDLTEMGNGDTWTSADGSMTVTKKEDGSYDFKLAEDAPAKELTVRATDADKDTVEKDVSLTTKPEIKTHIPDPGDGFTKSETEGLISVDEGSQPENVNQNNTVDEDHGSHGKSGTGTFDVQLHREAGSIELKTDDGQTVTLTVGADGSHTIPDGSTLTVQGVTVTITDMQQNDDGTWTVTYSYTFDGAKTHDAQHDMTLSGSIDITVTDTSGNDTATGELTVEVHDDVPVFGQMTQQTGHLNEHGAQKSLDFVLKEGSEATNKWNDFLQQNTDNKQHWEDPHYHSNSSNLQFGVNNGINIIPTHVQYTYENGRLEAVEDKHSTNWTSDLGGEYKDDKTLWLTEEGLGVGTKGSQGEHAFSGTGNYAEAVVLEVNNGAVSYGFDITFGDQSTGKVLISFYLTPRNNDDDDLVMQVEVDLADLESGRFFQELPDGFNKVIISPLPGEDKKYDSFTIEHLDVTRPSYVHEGQIPINVGADGLNDAGVTWNWDNSGLNGGKVSVNGTAGAGEYTVELHWDGNTVTAYLKGGSGDINLDGNVLFTGTLDKKTGKWSIERFYDFQMQDAEGNWVDPWYNVTFSATDTDGDTATANGQIDLSGDADLDRFDNVETGYWNSEKWGSAAANDNASDVLIGGAGDNDLMFGKGGKDVLFGDGSKEQLENAVHDFLVGNDVEFKDITGSLDAHAKGPNETLVDNLYTAVKDAFEKGDAGGKLAALLSAIEEGQQGGDDALFGGQDDDILFAGAGNDYLNGGAGKDLLFGGAGNDIIMYGEGDLIHGGSGVDILLAGKGDNVDLKSENIQDVEVLLKATDTNVENLGITSNDALAQYGIEMNGDNLYLTNKWTQDSDGHYHANFNGHDLELTVQGTVTVTSDLDTLPSQRPTDNSTQDQPGAPIPGQSDDSSQSSTDDTSESDSSVISSSTGSSLKFVADVSSVKDSRDDGSLSGDDDLNGSTGSDSLSAGDELIQYDPTDYAVFGGDNGIAVLLSNDTDADSLDDLLKAPLGGDKPHVDGVELFLKGEGVEDLTRMSDLQQHGITVDEENKTVTLDEGWKKAEDGSAYVNDNGWTLETSNVTVQEGADEAAQQAANQILLTQQG